jgi:SAM-dependent methyltransferase
MSSAESTLISSIHSRFVFPRRQRVLAGRIAPLISPGSTVLDVGTGDGSIAAAVQQASASVRVTGIDILVRNNTAIPVFEFDGTRIPFPDRSHDVVLFIDVLHHAGNPQQLLNEAARVARRCVIIKDHNREGFLADFTLRLMDWVGNARFGVALPYSFWNTQEWAAAYRTAGLEAVATQVKLGLYPWWVDWIFGRNLHSIVVLKVKSPA